MRLPILPIVLLAGVLGYTYTGEESAMYPAMAVMAFFVVMHILGIGGLLTKLGKQYQSDTRGKDTDKDLGLSFLFQVSMLLCAYQTYLIGFAVFSGAVVVHSLTIIVSIAISKLTGE